MFATLKSAPAKRSSTCVESVLVSLQNAYAIVTFKGGNTYFYSKVSRRAILALKMSSTMSLGFWVNKHCIRGAKVITTRIYG
jgi:hypothetical protein|tara:strand:- start:105 stop:350 length:246 start_codon:yes stop_codon:yes gene_type:complete